MFTASRIKLISILVKEKAAPIGTKETYRGNWGKLYS